MADTVKLGPFTGVNNRLKRHALYDAVAKTYALHDAENIIIDTTGRLRRRGGFTLLQSLTSGDSLWCDGTNMYYRNNGYLYRDGVVLETVSGRCSYAQFPGGGVIYTDTTSLRYINADGNSHNLAPARPAPPTTGITSGSLQPAEYLIAITGLDVNSAEGPASQVVAETLSSTGGITITLPTKPAGIDAYNIYVSGPNGEVLTLHGSTTSSDYTVTTYADGRKLSTGGLLNTPPGSVVRIYNGRLLVVAGRVLYISEAYNFGVYDPSAGYFVFPDDISVVVPMQNGVYIAADRTYWSDGNDIRAADLVEVLPYGAIPGSDSKSDADETAVWMSVKGLIVADINGQATNVQSHDLALTVDGTRGATLYISDEDRVVASTNG